MLFLVEIRGSCTTYCSKRPLAAGFPVNPLTCYIFYGGCNFASRKSCRPPRKTEKRRTGWGNHQLKPWFLKRKSSFWRTRKYRQESSKPRYVYSNNRHKGEFPFQQPWIKGSKLWTFWISIDLRVEPSVKKLKFSFQIVGICKGSTTVCAGSSPLSLWWLESSTSGVFHDQNFRSWNCGFSCWLIPGYPPKEIVGLKRLTPPMIPKIRDQLWSGLCFLPMGKLGICGGTFPTEAFVFLTLSKHP